MHNFEMQLNYQEVVRDLYPRVAPLTPAGQVKEIRGLSIVSSLSKVPIGSQCKISSKLGEISAEVIGFSQGHSILMPIGRNQGIQEGDLVKFTSDKSTIPVSNSLLGRILNAHGESIDSLGPIEMLEDYPLYNAKASITRRKMIDQPFYTGIKSIDGLCTCGSGQRMAILAGSGVGKSTLMGMIARNSIADVNVIGLIGERAREVNEFIHGELQEAGLKKSVIIVATSDEPALLRMKAAYTATAIAEYFRDRGAKVNLMVDSLTRFSMASREIGLSLGEPPTVKGYTPSIFAKLPELLERAGTCEGEGSITGFYTILTEGDDIQDPIADTVRSIVDGHIVLSRKLANEGQYPPIDILNSLSRVLNLVSSKEHQSLVSSFRELLTSYQEVEDFIKLGLYQSGSNPKVDLAVQLSEEFLGFLKQDRSEFFSFEETLAQMKKIIRQWNVS